MVLGRATKRILGNRISAYSSTSDGPIDEHTPNGNKCSQVACPDKHGTCVRSYQSKLTPDTGNALDSNVTLGISISGVLALDPVYYKTEAFVHEEHDCKPPCVIRRGDDWYLM